MNAIELPPDSVVEEIEPDYAGLLDAAAIDKAIHLLQLKRTLVEQEFEISNQQGLRFQHAAEVDKLEARLETDTGLSAFDKQHIRGRIVCHKAKYLKSLRISAIAQMTIKVYRQALRD